MAERVVFDTNAMISGLLWKGKPYHCLLLARARVIQSVYCDAMLAELTEKLRTKSSIQRTTSMQSLLIYAGTRSKLK